MRYIIVKKVERAITNGHFFIKKKLYGWLDREGDRIKGNKIQF
jgi:hypothetical protein